MVFHGKMERTKQQNILRKKWILGSVFTFTFFQFQEDCKYWSLYFGHDTVHAVLYNGISMVKCVGKIG